MSGITSAAVRVGPRTAAVLALASVAGVMLFCWPLFVKVDAGSTSHLSDAPFAFVALLPLLVVVVLASFADGSMDAKALAMLGVLSALNAALRPLGAGTNGIELVFFVLVLAGRVFGPGFGFVLGSLSLFASALLTAGVGPWLPFQMLASAWIGLGAGLLPRRVRGRAEVLMLAAYGIAVAYVFGVLMNMSFWPFAVGTGGAGATSLSFVAGDPLGENLSRFLVFTLTTSTLTWDTGRAITNALALLLLGPPVLATLRRAARRASFGATPTFADVSGPEVALATHAPDNSVEGEGVGVSRSGPAFAPPRPSPHGPSGGG